MRYSQTLFTNHLIRVKEDINIKIDKDKLRLYIDGDELIKIKDGLNKEEVISAIVREYPTWDQLELEVEYL